MGCIFLNLIRGKRGLENLRKRGGKAKKRGLSKEQTPVIIARDCTEETLSQRLNFVNSEEVTNVLKPMIAPGSVLCAYGNNVYPSVAENCSALHKQLNLKQV